MSVKNMMIFLIIIFQYIYQVNTFPNGAPVQACQTLRPQHRDFTDSNLGYSLDAPGTFTPGVPVLSKFL